MRMRQLHLKCGAPTAAAMRKAIKDFAAPRLAPASLSEFLSNKRPNALPKQDFLRGFVAACLLYRGDQPHQVTAQLKTWDTWWATLILASGAPPVTIAPRPPATPAPAGGKRRARCHPLSIVVGLLAGLALGVGATLTIPALFQADNSHPHELRVEVGRPASESTADGGCPSHQAAIHNGRAAPMGIILYRECYDHLDVYLTDVLADGYCIFSVIHWSNGQSDTTSRACPAPHPSYTEIPRRTKDFWVELVAVEH